jgi:cupin fold WbuC family metalloprotein
MYKLICKDQINKLKEEATLALLGRARICLHGSHSHLTQESVICASNKNYFRPHKHPRDISESYCIIEGKMQIDFFGDSGKWLEHIVLGEIGSQYPFLYRLNQSAYHWVRPISEVLVYHEVLTGPWEKQRIVHYANFSPEESDEIGILIFNKLYKLESLVKNEAT